MSKRKFSKLGIALAVPVVLLSLPTASALADDNSGPGGHHYDDATPLGQTEIIETGQSWASCHAPVIEQPYSPFKDDRDYIMAPGGSFEDQAAGWQLSEGGSIVPGDDGFTAAGRLATSHAEGSLLRLEDGASALSPAMCVDLNYPLFRLTSAADDEDAELEVEVVYPNAPNPAFAEVEELEGDDGDFKTTVKVAKTPTSKASKTAWYVSDEIDLRPDLGGSEWGGRLVALRFTADDGAWQIDDVYVDPRRYS